MDFHRKSRYLSHSLLVRKTRSWLSQFAAVQPKYSTAISAYPTTVGETKKHGKTVGNLHLPEG